MARGRRGFSTPAPKPYDMVPLPERPPERRKPAGHDKYDSTRFTGHITGAIEALSPVQVASGVIDLGQDVPLIKTAVRTGGRLVIPGSSLKGAIRSVVEAISDSCICKTCARRQIPRGFNECREDRLCVACRMFGAIGFQGHVSIYDAPMIQGDVVTMYVPELYAPSSRRRAYFNESREVIGRKFYMHGNLATGETPVEACDVGSRFRFSVQVDNLDKAEWGLLFIAWGFHPAHPFRLKIGGTKPACFGSIDIQLERIEMDGNARDRYLDWEERPQSNLEGDALDQWKEPCIQAAQDTLVKAPQLAKLADILRYPNDRNCPSGVY